MTAMTKTKAIAGLIVIILTCMILLTAMPQKAFAEELDNTNAYKGISSPSDAIVHNQTKKQSVLDEAPAITVFTHGMSSSFQHWGGIYVNNKFDHFDDNSLPMQLKNKLNGNATIYVAHSLNTYEIDYSQEVYCTINDVDYYPHYETSAGFSIQQVDDDGKLGDYLTGTQKITFSNHTIIIFEEHKLLGAKGEILNEPNIEISLRYKQLHDIIDKMLYGYNNIYGIVPRINLIGHSRGGLLNMMYANEHPYNVAPGQNNKYLQSIEVDESNTGFKSVDGVLYDFEVNVLWWYPLGRQESSYIVPSTVTHIKSGAISGFTFDLKSIYISSAVREIEYKAISSDIIIYTNASSVPDSWEIYGSQKENVKTGVSIEQYAALMQQQTVETL